jgi:hypothetical protein
MSFDTTCADCDDRLLEYAAGRVDPGEREHVERHLSTCARCREWLAIWRAVGLAMEEEVAVMPPDMYATEGWISLIARLPQQRDQLPMASDQSAGDQPMERDNLHTVELDENWGHHPRLGMQPPQAAAQPARRWTAPISVAATLVIIVLGATLFAALAGKSHVSAPGIATPGQASVQAGAPLPAGVELTFITLGGPGEYWATGVMTNSITGQPDKGVVLRFSDGRWVQVGDALPSGHLDGLDMVSANEGWAWGGDTFDAAVLLHIRGGTWQRVTVAAANSRGAPQFIRMRSADEGWLVMQNPKDASGNTTPSSLLHYAGGTWRPVEAPLPYLTDIAPVGPNEAWVLGGDGQSTSIIHFKPGEAEVALRMPQADGIGFSRLRALTPNDVWAVGVRQLADQEQDSWTPVVYHYDGGSWQAVNVNAPAGVQQIQVVSADDMWATRNMTTPAFSGQQFPEESRIQALYHFTAGRWRQVPLPYNDLNGLGVISDASTTGDAWAFGSYTTWTPEGDSSYSGGTHLVLLHYLNGGWTEYGR